MKSAWWEGFDSSKNGLSLEQNPHVKHSSAWIAWDRGFKTGTSHTDMFGNSRNTDGAGI